MAEAILGIIAQKAADIVVNQLIKERSRLSHVKEDLLWIETEMRRIQSYLEDAEAMQPKTKRLSNFIRDMWDLAYDVEDILDTYFPKMRSRRSRWKGLLGCSNLITARRFAKDVEDIKKRVDDITKARETFKIDESSRTRGVDAWDPRRTFPHVDEPNVVGFDNQIKDLAQKVLDEDLHDHHVVSIIGNAGLGKTTLARKVYNSIRQHFGCSAWICVSQQPNYKELLRDIARQVGLEKEKIEQGVESNLFAFLSGKRYAIVIDDIWDTKAWDALKVGLPMNSENGSRIILTSRNTKTLYGLPGNLFKADWLHNLTNLRTLRVNVPTKDIMKVLSMDVKPVSHELETLSKSLIKPIRARIDVQRKGNEATQRFLKNNLAQLLANRHYVKAYDKEKQTEEYITELNCLLRYDFIEEACVHILKQLSDMQKRRSVQIIVPSY
ncbi:hypothetical protein RHGRI_009032 [Rhododendron griersonianum]|uniref:AAA+ ATPase domain-containing protein n=1 Tax=Rhododendron griersonianum TaxID=479676 RepID=A0AAV6L3K6_9ERIC|nr:hypothetical protein RHGRI_009032 [Rhododendron griersonianum]